VVGRDDINNLHIIELQAFGTEVGNIAYGKPVLSSGSDQSAASSAGAAENKANDGDPSSYWDAGKYANQPWQKGGKIQFNIAHVRDNNANLAIYAHYLKDGKEVYEQKMDALYGMSNNTLMKPTQTLRLTSDYDYDSVQFEFRANYGGTSNYTFCSCQINTLSTEKLNNASIVNGTITGERSTKSSTYPNWAKDGATEGSCSIIFSQGENNGIKNLTVKDSVGFNMSAGDGSLLNHAYVSYKTLELGAFDSQGNKVDCSTMIRNSDFYDVTKWTTNKYILGYHFGYQDIEKWSHSRIYDVFYYDVNKNLISYEKGLMRFRQYEMPEGTCYINIALYDAEVPTSGNTDFGGAISLLEERDLPIRNFIEDCVIENNYSTGFAACGGQRWTIKGNTWRKNSGRMPGCDIDWEDGWNYMQCDMICDNEFLSYNNVITCAGMYSSVFYNNVFYGNNVFYAKSNYYSFVKNQVIKDEEKVTGSCGNVAFGTRSDIWIYDNTFTGGGSITNSRNHSTADYRINYIENHFSNGTTLTATGTEYITGCDFTGKVGIVSDNVQNSTISDCSYLTLKGTLKNCTLNNVSIYAGNSDHIKLLSCDMTDVSFPTGAHKVSTVLVDHCNIKFVDKNTFIGYDQYKPSVTVSNSVLDLSKVDRDFALVNAYSIENIVVNYLFKDNKVIKPDNLTGVILLASWIQDASKDKLTITLQNTNLDELTDCNKTTGNFVIIRDTAEDESSDDKTVVSDNSIS
ncbi:MAG: hypothetical protein IIV45_01175, partial [Lachnospiraceae bacterium]|nr:hypothetical protein [Lachnospiraceae bacterium]